MNSNNKQNFLSYLELALIKMSGFDDDKAVPAVRAENRSPETKAEEINTKETKHKEVKTAAEEKPQPAPVTEKADETVEDKDEEKTVQEVVEDTEAAEESTAVNEEDNSEQIAYLASLLLGASKDEKINDAIIYNRLALYKNESEKRKFYELLSRTELFASGKDAIIIVANDVEANNINSREIKEYLYSFLVNEFGIDKVIFAIKASEQKDLVEKYRELIRNKVNNVPPVEKPVIKKERSNEEKLKELFGDELRVEE